MNDEHSKDLSRLVVGAQDCDEARRFYNLPAGKHGDIEIIDMDP
jgi:hypothetical protein